MKTKQCGSCGGDEMTHGVRDVTSKYKGDVITVGNVDGWFCSHCGEVEFAKRDEGARYSAAFPGASPHFAPAVQRAMPLSPA